MDSNSGSVGWFYLSGTISIAFCTACFLGLLAFMLYRAPVYQYSPADIWEDFEVDPDWLKSLQEAQPIDFVEDFEYPKEEAPPQQKSAEDAIKELFGETNATVNPNDLLAQTPKLSAGKVALVDFSLDDLDKDGVKTKTNKPDLAAFNAINSSKAAQREIASQKPLEASYYKELYKRIYNAWQIRNSDLGKIARIEMRVERGGDFTYRIVSAPDDPFFRDRLVAALEQAKASKLDPPPRALTINIDFQVREEK
ncbi:MAG: TonB C-terminal domain-containing protein [Helicobacteraceae bacterium]|jgi:hypothetical protein|nr:TonB C-terminal domain-containing protein [Helicobacteraceae bacterium]